MRLQSQRQHSSNRRKLVAVLTLLAPAVGWSEEVGEQLRSSGDPLQNEAVDAQPNHFRSAKPAELVPLPRELSSPYGASMTLIGPVSRSAGQPPSSVQEDLRSDDRWLPRGSAVEPQTSQLQLVPSTEPNKPSDQPFPSRRHFDSTFLILPPQARTAPLSPIRFSAPANDSRAAFASPEANAGVTAEVDKAADNAADKPVDNAADEAADALHPGDDSQQLLHVRDPEQNEPPGLVEIDAGVTDLSAPIDGTDSVDPQSSVREEQESSNVEIRRLQLQDHARGDHAMLSITARSVGSRSAARMTVGDVPPHDENGIDREAAPAEAPGTPFTAPAAASHGIHGDQITAAGELILASGKSASGLPVLPQTAQLKATIQRGLNYYWERPEDAAQRTHWGMMHSIMVFDKDTQIINRRQRYNAVAWMAGNNPCRNQLLFSRDQQGITVRTGVGLQGHQGQLLAIFGLVNVPLDYPVYAARQKFTVADILQREQLDCRSGNELTFTLIALAHYADSDTSWVTADGQDWDVQRVIREELSQPIVGAACGGTHRLMGFAHAVRRRHAEGKPVTGQWDRADRYVKEFVDYTWTLQNRDGSMSTGWFERPEDNGNMDRKIQTTGHMLEFLLSTVPDSELQSPKMLRTVGYLAGTLYAERGHQWQIGPKGHALRALAMYHQRVFGDPAPWRSQAGAQSAAGPAAHRSVR